jgi:hypothetical protein
MDTGDASGGKRRIVDDAPVHEVDELREVG